MTVDAYKYDDGSKSITVEFDAKEREESIFATMLIDRFLDLPVMAFGGKAENKEAIIDGIKAALQVNPMVSNE